MKSEKTSSIFLNPVTLQTMLSVHMVNYDEVVDKVAEPWLDRLGNSADAKLALSLGNWLAGVVYLIKLIEEVWSGRRRLKLGEGSKRSLVSNLLTAWKEAMTNKRFMQNLAIPLFEGDPEDGIPNIREHLRLLERVHRNRNILFMIFKDWMPDKKELKQGINK